MTTEGASLLAEAKDRIERAGPRAPLSAAAEVHCARRSSRLWVDARWPTTKTRARQPSKCC